MKKPPAGRLRPFRLDEVPLDVRLRAAQHARTKTLPDDDRDPRDRLFAALTAPATDELAVQLARVARSPSPRIYWIPAAAWSKVMGP